MNVLKKYWISISLCIIILVLCFIKPPEIPVEIPMRNFDKLVHFLMFFGLSGTVFFDNSSYFRKPVNGWLIFWSSFLLPTILGGGIEIGQEYLTAYRTGDWMDFLFDEVGVIFGCLICLGINRKLLK